MEEIPSSFPCELILTDARLAFTALCPFLLALETTPGSCQGLRVLPESVHYLAEHPSGMKIRAWDKDFPREPAQSRTNGNRHKPQISCVSFQQVLCKLTKSCCAPKLV